MGIKVEGGRGRKKSGIGIYHVSLQFPSLCRQFYTLINYVCESFPDRLPSLPDHLFLAFMRLVESGLNDYGTEVRVLCLESIEGVATCRVRMEALQSSQALTHILEHFLKVSTVRPL